jgi:hypothetical protein
LALYVTQLLKLQKNKIITLWKLQECAYNMLVCTHVYFLFPKENKIDFKLLKTVKTAVIFD